jgi:hypothetical protein
MVSALGDLPLELSAFSSFFFASHTSKQVAPSLTIIGSTTQDGRGGYGINCISTLLKFSQAGGSARLASRSCRS